MTVGISINENEMYICEIIGIEKPLYAKYSAMKNKFLLLTILALVAIVISSCYSSRKSGCPMNPQGNYRYRG